MNEEDPIDRMRAIVEWCNSIDENWWIPEGNPSPTIPLICEIYTLCQTWDAACPGSLREHEDPRARAAFHAWAKRAGWSR